MAFGSPRVTFVAAWCSLFVLKVVLAAVLPLFGDEAFYWQEGRHLAWAYSDLPGQTAWLARLGVAVGGDSLLGLRWPFLLIGAAIPWQVVRLGAYWFGAEAGWRAGLLALLLPLAGTLGLLALPDVPMTGAALLCLHAGARLLRGVERGACLMLATGLALGAFAHYRFAVVIAAGLVGLLSSQGGRQALRDHRVWLAVLVGALAWAPLLLWNLAHDDAGLRFQLVDRHPWSPHAEGAWYPLMQALCVTPVLFVALLLTLWHAWRRRHEPGAVPWAYLLGVAGVPVLGFFLLGFFADSERVSFHWPLPGCLALAAAAPVVIAGWSVAWRRTLHAVAALGLMATLASFAIAATPTLRARLADSRWYPDNFAGWNEVAKAVRTQQGALPEGTRLVVDNFMLGAELGFALGDPDIAVLDHPLTHKHGRAPQLRLWALETAGRTEWGRSPVLLVVEDTARPLKQRLTGYHALCDRVGALSPPQVVNVDHGRKRFVLFSLPDGARDGPCVAPALAWIDTPTEDASVPARFEVAGWAFKDGAGLRRVEITLDDEVVAEADYGAAMPAVTAFWRISSDPNQPRVGFRAWVDARGLEPGAHRLGLRLHGRDGSAEPWPSQPVVIEPESDEPDRP